MGYSTQSDIESAYGVANVARWSQLEPDETAADTDRIARAIEVADGQINGKFRDKRYAIPFGTGTGGEYDPVIVNWSAILAGHWLLHARPSRDTDAADATADRAAAAEAEMTLYLSTRVLDAPFAADKDVTSPIPMTAANETQVNAPWGSDPCGL